MAYFVIEVILREKLYISDRKISLKINESVEFEWHSVASFCKTTEQNYIGTSIFFISISNLEYNLFRHVDGPKLEKVTQISGRKRWVN